MKYKYPGFSRNRKHNHLLEQKVISYINGVKGALPEIPMPKITSKRKPRKQETLPRQQGERELVKRIINHLRANGCVAGRIKTTGTFMGMGYAKDPYLFLGFPDVAAFHPTNGFYFVECKYGRGCLRPEQIQFKSLCEIAGVRHIVAFKLEDVLEITR